MEIKIRKRGTAYPAFMIAMAVWIMLALSGCTGAPSFTLNPQDLYALPRLPAKYTELSNLLGELLNNGAEYASPSSGSNMQSVQMVDLDGDGREEAVACLRNPGDEKPLKLYIFTAEGDTYRIMKTIEGTGTSVYSVAYTDMDNDGKMEIAVGWNAAAELRVLEIYALNRVNPLVRTDYVKYATGDLNEDERLELVVIRTGPEGDSAAEYYDWREDGTLGSRSRARVSVTMAELAQQGRVRVGVLRGGKPALFVTGVTAQNMAVTDVLALRGEEMINLVLDQATGVSRDITPFFSLYPAEMNSDGITEVPHAVVLNGPEGGDGDMPYTPYIRGAYRASGEADIPARDDTTPTPALTPTGIPASAPPAASLTPATAMTPVFTPTPTPTPTSTPTPTPTPPPDQYVIEWRQYDLSGAPAAVMRTYHNSDDGWYLRLPDAWKNRFAVSRSTSTGEAAVTFSLLEDNRPFLRISALSGSGREVRSVRGDRFTLSRQPDTIYTAELLEASTDFDPPLAETDIRGAFSLILREWLSGDN